MSRRDREKTGLVVRDVGEFWCDGSSSDQFSPRDGCLTVCFPQDGLPGFLPLLHGCGGVPACGEVSAAAQIQLEGGAPPRGVGSSSATWCSSPGKRHGEQTGGGRRKS